MANPIILYVDDEPDALKVIGLGLEGRGYTVVTCGNGNDALELLKTKIPDLILADLRMEPMNGFDFFQAVKKMNTLQHTPFFFLTAVNDYLAQKYGQNLGVDAYITKPVDLDDLEAMIKNKLST